MAYAIEGRPPLIDHRLVEFMFTLPSHYRIHRGVQKKLLKDVAASYLPKNVICRPKAPFVAPLRAWIRGPLAPMVGDVLSYDSVKRRGLLRPERVEQLVKNDREGIEDNSMLIWTFLTQELWFRTFFSKG
jgi:asparagine synthase (glutamine-hydrolysing)